MTMERRLTGETPSVKLPRGAVDTQTHMYLPGFPAQPGGPALPPGELPTPGQYAQVMDWLGIGRVVVTQGNAHQHDNGNLIACLAELGEVARGVAVISARTSEAELQRLGDGGIVGARIMDLPGGAVGLGELESVDERAAASGWMLAVQFDGSSILQHEERLRRLRSRWVLDHHGKFFSGATPDGPEIAAVKRLIDGGRCWFKFAGVYESSKAGAPAYEDVAVNARAIAAHAPERIVWGTNWPHNMVRTTDEYPDDALLADTVLGWLHGAGNLERALVDNPEELYGFPSS